VTVASALDAGCRPAHQEHSTAAWRSNDYSMVRGTARFCQSEVKTGDVALEDRKDTGDMQHLTASPWDPLKKGLQGWPRDSRAGIN